MLQNQLNLQPLYTDARLAELLEALDELHTAASEGQLYNVISLNQREVLAWLREVVYTAEEAMLEIEQTTPAYDQLVLRVVEKPVRAEGQIKIVGQYPVSGQEPA
jgi:hypothetical protein